MHCSLIVYVQYMQIYMHSALEVHKAHSLHSALTMHNIQTVHKARTIYSWGQHLLIFDQYLQLFINILNIIYDNFGSIIAKICISICNCCKKNICNYYETNICIYWGSIIAIIGIKFCSFCKQNISKNCDK